MENGYLNSRSRKRDQLLPEYGLWCWRMGLPMVWYEARSVGSRLSRVHLELFTTPGRLSTRGHAALIALSAGYVPARNGSISPHGAVWDRVAPEHAAAFASAVFRTVRRAGHYEITTPAEEKPEARPRLVEIRRARSA